ncbi:MAG: putative alpha,4-glucosyltransferase [Ilumatobacteraceae bacterium]|nr:putative alpha,4-glucosyltransferase [Ilumatobacteraceae bacterium]
MLSWEYPPLVVGGIAAHVDGLARAMVRSGHEVVVLSLHTNEAPDDSVVEGVRILRAKIDLPWIPDDNLVGRMASANHQITQLVAQLGAWRPDVVHAHDWLVAWAGDTISTLWSVPLVATIHATERGRHGGHVPPGMPAAINAVEWWLTYQAAHVICCSQFMIREVVSGFDLPVTKVHMVPNGVDLAVWEPNLLELATPREPLVVAWGRVQYEKGFQVLARAVGALRQRVPGIRCVIAGRGSYLAELQTQIDVEGLADVVHLAGFVSDADLRGLLHQAGCGVIPSLYEPFGIVALESMASGAPTVVARTGGLAEIVGGTGAGLLFEPGNHHDLADRIADVLTQPALATELQTTAAKVLSERYTWDAIAETTLSVYTTAVSPITDVQLPSRDAKRPTVQR